MVLDALELPSAKLNLLPASDLFSGAGDLPLLECISPKCTALIALQGAQVLSFCPEGENDLLWLSPLESFVAGKAIRGGIPLCLPWFGVNRREPDLAKHGFARHQSWVLENVAEADDGNLVLNFSFQPSAADLALFPWPFSAQLEVSLGESLQLSLTMSNSGVAAMPLSFAMHSYFAVAALDKLALKGVSGAEYLDNCRQLARFQQDEALRFNVEIDRVYEGLGGEQQLCDTARTMTVTGSGCDTVVVWNPGEALAKNMADVGEHFSEYLCVERGMAFADELQLAPGQQHVAIMTVAKAC
ncbi:D-hexose-6-phosphate mutarotase [Zhongshania guokunii]|uniref:Putative glucose-6-phosphate 1-epimerase n=1 Tax=Zhongshania guokunii TaxID=641783 RepID=A0ABV3U919_9GAMM